MLNPGMQRRRGHFLKVIGLRKTNVTQAQAAADMDAIADRLSREYPDTNQGWSLRQRPLAEVLIGPVRPAMLLIAGAVGLLLLIACGNVANLTPRALHGAAARIRRPLRARRQPRPHDSPDSRPKALSSRSRAA